MRSPKYDGRELQSFFACIVIPSSTRRKQSRQVELTISLTGLRSPRRKAVCEVSGRRSLVNASTRTHDPPHDLAFLPDVVGHPLAPCAFSMKSLN